MKKRVSAACLATIWGLVLLMTGCSDNTTANSSNVMSSAAFSSAVSASFSSTTPSADNQVYIDLLTPVLKELGETGAIESLIVDAPEDMHDADYKMQTVHFAVGGRTLQATFFITPEDGEKTLTAISKEDSALHYYYYPDAASINQLGASFKIHLYDYETEEEIDIMGETSAVDSIAEQSVNDIIQKLDDVTINQKQVSDDTLVLNVNVDSSRGETNEDFATIYYYNIMQFISEYLEIKPAPYNAISFYALIDGNSVGFLMYNHFTEIGLIGTTRPVILDPEMKTAFNEKYDEYMLDIDVDTVKAKLESESE